MILRGETVIASQSAIWLVTALFLLLLPQTILTFAAGPPSPDAVGVARIFGAELAGLALVSWFTRREGDPSVYSRILFSYVVSNTLGFAASLYATVAGVFNRRCWLFAALYLLYAVAFIYLCLARRGRETGSARAAPEAAPPQRKKASDSPV